MTTSELFAATAAQAMTLDPDHIEAVIRDTAAGWPGSGGGEPVSGGGTSDPTASAAVRRVSSSNPDYDTADIGPLTTATAGVVRSVSIIASKCSSASEPTEYEEAVHLAHLIVEMDMITTAIDVGIDLAREVFRFRDHVNTIQRIHDGHCAHAPDEFTRSMQASTGCRSCARFASDAPRISRMLCQPCWRQLQDLASLGDPVELQLDPAYWPSEGMWRARADGRRVRFKQEWQSWIVGHGLSPEAVLADRREKRRGA